MEFCAKTDAVDTTSKLKIVMNFIIKTGKGVDRPARKIQDDMTDGFNKKYIFAQMSEKIITQNACVPEKLQK